MQNRAPLAPVDLPASNVVSLPSLVLLGCDPELEARAQSISRRAKVLARAIPIPFLRSNITAMRPLVLIVPMRVYALAPRGFELLAEEANASLLQLDSEPVAPIVLEYRIMEALISASERRAREERLAYELRDHP